MSENDMGKSVYKLADGSIAQIARLLQVAILTGTDVVDNLRMLRLNTDSDGMLIIPDPVYLGQFEEMLNKLASQLPTYESVEEN